MPRQAKPASERKTHRAKAAKPDGDGAAAERKMTNGFDADELAGFCEQIDAEQARIDAIMAKAQEDCAPMRDSIAKIKKDAAEAGLPKTEFATLLRFRRLSAQRDRVADKLDTEQRTNFDMMKEALGGFADTPLGSAAMDAADSADKAGATVQ